MLRLLIPKKAKPKGRSPMRTQGGGLWGQWFALFVPKPMNEEQVPPALREAVTAQLPGHSPRWYAAAPVAGGTFTAVDFELYDPAGRFLHLGLWTDSEDAHPRLLAAVTVRVRFDEPFVCSGDARPGIPAVETGQAPAVGGWAWDRRVTTVVGFTGDGDEIRTRTINGCWLLVSAGADAGGWQEFRALDSRGQVMYGKAIQKP